MKFDLMLSTSKRLSLFKETVDSFFKINPDVNNWINKVFILDDRSTWEERKEMVDYLCSYIVGNPITICFDSNVKFEWIDKFNFIGKVTESEYVFFLEDDWKSIEPINFSELFEEMENNDTTQIALCDPIWIQNDELIQNNKTNDYYWDNPFPNDFKHITHKTSNGLWGWTIVTMRHYTNNPALTKSKIFKETIFPNDKNFEVLFAEKQINPKQKFSKKLHFEHIGYENSLINKN